MIDNALIMLEALCYSLWQTYSSDIMIIGAIGAEDKAGQIKALIQAIDSTLEVVEVPTSAVWYDSELIEKLRHYGE